MHGMRFDWSDEAAGNAAGVDDAAGVDGAVGVDGAAGVDGAVGGVPEALQLPVLVSKDEREQQKHEQVSKLSLTL